MRPPLTRQQKRRVQRINEFRVRRRTLCTLLLVLLLRLREEELDDLEDDIDAQIAKRASLRSRARRDWHEYIRPILSDNTFKACFRMDYSSFMHLVKLLENTLQRDVKMGNLRNGAVCVEFQLAMTIRLLAGGSVYDVMSLHVVAKSTVHHIFHRVVDALNDCSALDCVWPEGDDVTKSAAIFRERSSNDVIQHAVGAMDGLFVRIQKPSKRMHSLPKRFYSGHKKAFGFNFQGICNGNYEIIAWTMNCPGSQNDRTAFAHSGFEQLLLGLPEGFCVLGDAAYPASDRVLVPFPGLNLELSQDSFNFAQSQCRMAIEQTFGIMVRTWGILWKPIEYSFERVSSVMDAVVRLHNFVRRRRVGVATTDVNRSTTCPVDFTPESTIIGDYFQTVQSRTGRPAALQPSSVRENIRCMLQIQGIVRPADNVHRNEGWRRP